VSTFKRSAYRHLPLAMLAVAGIAIVASAAFGAVAQITLPASGDQAAARLAASPRHGEWATIESHGDRIEAYVVYPERSDAAPVVIVIHEIYGLNDWARAVADQLAAEGFIAIAPDMLSGKGPNGAGSASVDQQGAVSLMRSLQSPEITRRLNMAAQYATLLPAATQRFGVIGFCWGGSASFNFATARDDLGAAVVYYGTSPATETLRRVQAPIMGFYGGDDQRVNATIEPAQAELDRLGKRYQPNIFEGAGHGFLRQQDGRDGANMLASEQAWPATVQFLRTELETG